MLNTFWLVMVVGSVLCGAVTGRLTAVAQSTFVAANAAVTLAVGLIGVMTLWLGLMRVLREAGMLQVIARGMQPLMRRLFPAVPPDHPAMSSMILNFTANLLGLGNAATPFGLRAMRELESLSDDRDSVSDSMALFMAINTAGLSLFPTSIIAFRASLGSVAPAAIFLTTLLSTSMATLTAILSCKLLARLPRFRQPAILSAALPQGGSPGGDDTAGLEGEVAEAELKKLPATAAQRGFGLGLTLCSVLALLLALLREAQHQGLLAALKTAVSHWMVLLLIVGFVLLGTLRRVNVYDAVAAGGREGFVVARRIIPFMVAILVAVGMLQASGGVDLLVWALDPLTRLIGMPGAALPMALLRPLSGSGSLGMAVQIMKEHGPDSLVGQIVSTINGSTETTFYLLAVYLGVVQARNTRYTLLPCILADLAGMLTAVWSCRLML